MLNTKILKIKGDWQDVVDGCRATVKKPPLGHEPSRTFKENILIAEHEPIREIEIKWSWKNIPYWVAMHFKTHIWPSRTNTQRTDRTGVDRAGLPQDAPVDFEGRANPQHLIDTARKRLCTKASFETLMHMVDLKYTIGEIEPEISFVLVPNCVYRFGCPEMNPCGKWESFKNYCQKQDFDLFNASISARYKMYNEWSRKA